MRVRCPYCQNSQEVKPKSEEAEKMAEFFSWEYATTVHCEKCSEPFIEENNLIEEKE